MARHVCLASFSLKAVFSRGLPCAKRLATTRPVSQRAGLGKHGPVHSLFPFAIPMFLTRVAWSPAWTSGAEHRQPELVPLWLCLAPPPCSVPRKILLLPEWVPVENVLIIQQQQLGGVLAGPSPTSPFVSSPMTAPSLSSSFDALPLE